MGRNAQPLELAIIKGANKKDPQRYKGETPKNDEPLGDCPAHLSTKAKEAWLELEANALPGVLTGSDRFMMEIAAGLLGELRAKKQRFPVGKYSQLISALSRLGLSPADRQKIGGGNGKKKPGGFSQFTQ